MCSLFAQFNSEALFQTTEMFREGRTQWKIFLFSLKLYLQDNFQEILTLLDLDYWCCTYFVPLPEMLKKKNVKLHVFIKSLSHHLGEAAIYVNCSCVIVVCAVVLLRHCTRIEQKETSCLV